MSLSEAGPGRFGGQQSSTDFRHTALYHYCVCKPAVPLCSTLPCCLPLLVASLQLVALFRFPLPYVTRNALEMRCFLVVELVHACRWAHAASQCTHAKPQKESNHAQEQKKRCSATVADAHTHTYDPAALAIHRAHVNTQTFTDARRHLRPTWLRSLALSRSTHVCQDPLCRIIVGSPMSSLSAVRGAQAQ